MRIPNVYFVPMNGKGIYCPGCAKAAGISRGISTKHYAREPLTCTSCGTSITRVAPELGPAYQKQATPAEARELVAKLDAMDCTRELNAMTPDQLAQAIADHQQATKPAEDKPLATFGLFGFQPTPATGRQRPLFGDDAAPTSAAPWPDAKPAATFSKTYPRPWSKATPADAKIAKKFDAGATPDLF